MMRLLALAALSVAACQPAPEGMNWTRVDRGSLSIPVDVSGAIRSVDSERISPPGIPYVWSYKIAMLAEEGAAVEEGQPIAMFDPSDLRRRLEAKTSERDQAARQLKVTMASAKVARQDEKLALAEARVELRKAELQADGPEGLTAVIELEKARLDLKLAGDKIAYLKKKAESATKRDEAETERWRRKRDRAQERVFEIERAIEAMTVKASRAGTVIHPTNWQGEKKKVGDNAWRAESILELVTLDEMEAAGEIDEVDISRVAVGQGVALRLDALPDVELAGTVEEVRESVGRASAENPLKVARLVISLAPNADAKLRPGMRFRGEIESDRVDDALLLPLDAIFPTVDGPVARRATADGWEPIPVVLGRRNAYEVVVADGLDEGDRVLQHEEDPA